MNEKRARLTQANYGVPAQPAKDYEKGDILRPEHAKAAVDAGVAEWIEEEPVAVPGKKLSISVQAVTNGTKVVRSNAGAFGREMLAAKVSGGSVGGKPAIVVVESWESENQITVSQALDTGTPVLSIETLPSS